MSFEFALALGFFLIVSTIVLLLVRMESRRRTAEDDQFRREASACGWSVEAAVERGFRVRRWRGTTDSIAWTAESRRALHQKRHGQRRQQRMCWWADTLRGPRAPILCMGVPDGQETPSFTVAEGESLIAKLAQKAAGVVFDHAVDVYFGKDSGDQVDAAALRKVDGATMPGFVVMAADPADAARYLASGMRDAVTRFQRDCKPADPEESSPWVLLLPRRICAARMDPIASTKELESFARAGAALVRRT